jgi:hypothetical protein
MATPSRTRASEPVAADDRLPRTFARPECDGGEEPPLMLALADLMGDPNGEVVLFNDSGLRSLALALDMEVAIVEEGEAERNATAAGEDVSGFRYMRFDNGIKLYHQPDLDLILVREQPSLS